MVISGIVFLPQMDMNQRKSIAIGGGILLIRFLYSAFFVLIFPSVVRADLPLTIEELLTAQDRYRLEFGLIYANSERRNVDSRFASIQTGANSFVLLPVDVGDERRNSDIFAMTTGFRYGLTDETEVFTRLTGTVDSVRIQDTDGTDSRTSQQLSDLVIGINHEFSGDNDTPALLGFAEISIAENTTIDGSDFVYAKTGQIGFTAYRSIDPVVLALTAGYRYAGTRDINDLSVDPGDLLFINPNVHFAVNNEITLSGGIQWTLTDKDKVAGESIGILNTETDLEFSLGYAPSERTTLNVTALTDVSGDSGAQVGFNLLYKFGDLSTEE